MRVPGTIWRPIPPGVNDPPIIPIGIIWHVDAGNAYSLYEYFSERSGGVESHFHVRKDGTSEQYRDTTREADANYQGNSFIIDEKRYGFLSMESQGFEAGLWTPPQLAEMKRITRVTATAHGYPLRVCPAWNEPGVGYHVMFGAPGPWAPRAKTCPGPERVRQFKTNVVPWLAQNGVTDVELTDMVDLTAGMSANLGGAQAMSVEDLLGYAGAGGFQILQRLKAVQLKQEVILDAISAVGEIDEDALAAKIAEIDRTVGVDAVADEIAERMQE